MKKKAVTADTLYIDLKHILKLWDYHHAASDLASMTWEAVGADETDIEGIIKKLCAKYNVSVPGTYAPNIQISEAVDEILDEINPCEDASGM